MNPALQQLKDIHLPPYIGTWPPAIGWIILSTVCFFILIYGSYYWYKQRKQNYAIKFALKKLKQLEKLSLNNPHHINIAEEISTLLRRTALHYFSRSSIAGLTGKSWLKFLTNNLHHLLNENLEYLLIVAPYQKSVQADLKPLLTFTEAWLMTLIKRKNTPYQFSKRVSLIEASNSKTLRE
jgi:hypothetical protein